MTFCCPIHGYYTPTPGVTIALCPRCSAAQPNPLPAPCKRCGGTGEEPTPPAQTEQGEDA